MHTRFVIAFEKKISQKNKVFKSLKLNVIVLIFRFVGILKNKKIGLEWGLERVGVGLES